jgi:hypothetical protein
MKKLKADQEKALAVEVGDLLDGLPGLRMLTRDDADAVDAVRRERRAGLDEEGYDALFNAAVADIESAPQILSKIRKLFGDVVVLPPSDHTMRYAALAKGIEEINKHGTKGVYLGFQYASILHALEHQDDSRRGRGQKQRLTNLSPDAATKSAETRAKFRADLIENARALRTRHGWDRQRIADDLAPRVKRSPRTVYDVIGPAFKD